MLLESNQNSRSPYSKEKERTLMFPRDWAGFFRCRLWTVTHMEFVQTGIPEVQGYLWSSAKHLYILVCVRLRWNVRWLKIRPRAILCSIPRNYVLGSVDKPEYGEFQAVSTAFFSLRGHAIGYLGTDWMETIFASV